jgi:hypothetical protein
MPQPRTAKTIVTVAIVLIFFLLLGIAGGMDKADAAVNPPDHEHHCYAVADAVGSEPIEVPCDVPAPVEAPAPEEPPRVIAVPAPVVVTPAFVRAQTIHAPRRSRRIHRSFPHA